MKKYIVIETSVDNRDARHTTRKFVTILSKNRKDIKRRTEGRRILSKHYTNSPTKLIQSLCD